MTEPVYEAGGPVIRPGDGGGVAGAFGPEAVAAVLSIIVVVALIASRLAFAGGGTATASPSPSQSGPTVTPNPEVRLRVVVGTLIQINATLAEARKDLADQLKSNPLDVAKVKRTMSQIIQQMLAAEPLARELAATPQGGVLGVQLGAVYADLDARASDATDISITSLAAYRINAEALIGILDLLPPLDQRLGIMASGLPDPGGSAPPSGEPSVIPSDSPSPSAAPTATVAPTPTPPPVTPPPSPPPGSPPASALPTQTPGPNPLVNPGFEEGVGPPWELRLNGAAQAMPTADSQQPHSGKLSARIDISVPTSSQAFVSLQQPGLKIVSSANYRITLWARSTAPRQIRVRILGPSGQTLGNGTQVFTITPTWTVLLLPMTSIVPTDNGSIAIDVGGSGETVWVDDVSITQGP
jgi:hypothetical protein